MTFATRAGAHERLSLDVGRFRGAKPRHFSALLRSARSLLRAQLYTVIEPLVQGGSRR